MRPMVCIPNVLVEVASHPFVVMLARLQHHKVPRSSTKHSKAIHGRIVIYHYTLLPIDPPQASKWQAISL